MCQPPTLRIDLKEDVASLTDFARNTRQHAEELARGGRARILTWNGKRAEKRRDSELENEGRELCCNESGSIPRLRHFAGNALHPPHPP